MTHLIVQEKNMTIKKLSCILPEGNIEIEVILKTFKGMHLFKQGTQYHQLQCPLWSDKVGPCCQICKKQEIH